MNNNGALASDFYEDGNRQVVDAAHEDFSEGQKRFLPKKRGQSLLKRKAKVRRRIER